MTKRKKYVVYILAAMNALMILNVRRMLTFLNKFTFKTGTFLQ